MLGEKGDNEAAESMYRRVLAIWRQTLGEDHPDLDGKVFRLSSLKGKKVLVFAWAPY